MKGSEEYLKRESCIVLISNAPATYSNRELLETYKGPQVVENSFRELKSPSVASVIYLKNPKRIEGLSMLLTFSLLVRAIIQYRLRKGLWEYQEKNPEEELRVGWRNRPLKNPTYKLLLYMPDYKNEPAGIEKLLPWSEFIKEHYTGPIDVETSTSEHHDALPL